MQYRQGGSSGFGLKNPLPFTKLCPQQSEGKKDKVRKCQLLDGLVALMKLMNFQKTDSTIFYILEMKILRQPTRQECQFFLSLDSHSQCCNHRPETINNILLSLGTVKFSLVKVINLSSISNREIFPLRPGIK